MNKTPKPEKMWMLWRPVTGFSHMAPVATRKMLMELYDIDGESGYLPVQVLVTPILKKKP